MCAIVLCSYVLLLCAYILFYSCALLLCDAILCYYCVLLCAVVLDERSLSPWWYAADIWGTAAQTAGAMLLYRPAYRRAVNRGSQLLVTQVAGG